MNKVRKMIKRGKTEAAERKRDGRKNSEAKWVDYGGDHELQRVPGQERRQN